ncbi:hypothetical protein [Marinobacter caseinilyticus]|uniref:hypothetical protein n=1 Tax=Marinobacter caseinilyticus TaxID=2692195 RepID=UPI00140AB5F3|nr:hypothetical protein [Marinobacter caseinilyticus]
MKSPATITLNIGNALPFGNEKDTARIISLWESLDDYFRHRPFVAQSGINGKAKHYTISLNTESMVNMMTEAQTVSGSFSNHLASHIDDSSVSVSGELTITIGNERHSQDELETYQVATVFIQQLVMAANIALPGSIQILDAKYVGEGARHYEAQSFDSRLLYGAMTTAKANGSPSLHFHSFAIIWEWLDQCEVSHRSTAISDINKVLFTLLKVAEQRHEYSARTVLMVVYQLEVLLDHRDPSYLALTRNRARLVLGEIPESADCFAELYDVRNSLFLAHQPVHRPPLICHGTADALKEQIGQHNTAVELGTALVLALIQDLVTHNAQRYEFTETFSRH